MKTDRAFGLLGLLLVVACIGAAATLDRWFMSWAGNRAAELNPLRFAIGDGQKIFAGHFYRKADVYFHSGMYPSIFDNNESFQTAHIGADAGVADSRNSGNEGNFLGEPRDLIERFSRYFFPSQHTHLDAGGAVAHGHDHSHGGHGHDHHHHHGEGELADEGGSGEVREMLPWLKLAQQLDPEDPLTYTVTAYWLRNRMHKPREAEAAVREGLRHLPNHPALLFELGRIYSDQHQDVPRARNVWRAARKSWQEQEASQPEPDTFMLGQILAHLGILESEAGNLELAIDYWQQAKLFSPAPEAVAERIAELHQKLAASPVAP